MALGVLRSRPAWVALQVLAGLPWPARRVLATTIGRVADRVQRRPGEHPLALPATVATLWLSGRVHRVGPVVDAALRRGPLGAMTTDRLARLALGMDEPALADRILAAGGVDRAVTPERLALDGQVHLAMGRYRAASSALWMAVALRPDRASWRRAAERAEAECRVLDPGWLPRSAVAPAGARHHPRAGHILHVLTNSLPQRQAGYSVRAQDVGRCQIGVGLVPAMVTRAGFPGTIGATAAPSPERVGDVPYHRIDPDLAPGTLPDEIVERTIAGLLELAPRLGAALLQPTSDHRNARAALAVREHLRVPVVYEVRGFLEETWRSRMGDGVLGSDRYAGTRAIETECMQAADAVVTLSETMRRHILDRTGRSPDDVVVVPNAVDIDRFRPGPRDDALAAALGIAPEDTVVGYISSLVGYEGIRFLIEAMVEVRRRQPRTRLLLVGDGEDRAALEAQARASGLLAEGAVIFTGRVPHAEVARYYRTIDVFVVPRTADRVSQLVTPLKPYEAMAMAKPLVVSAIPALEEIVADGETGRTVPPEDVPSLAAVIEALVDDPQERARLGEAGRAWVGANRTWASNGQRYRALYRRLGVA